MTEQHNQTYATEAGTDRTKYLGIGGWLSFFIITVMYLAPIVEVGLFSMLWLGFIEHAGIEVVTGLPPIAFALLSVLELGFVAWGVAAAWRLKGLRVGAVRFVKIWILSYAACVIVAAIVTALLGMEQDLIFAQRKLIWMALWYAYFTFSRRVKATYAGKMDDMIPGDG
ncbi:MAG: DUF2569 family protein [Bacteroidetes bacterium]|nr:DUF2569 family protein [Bacteroidota bacterium]